MKDEKNKEILGVWATFNKYEEMKKLVIRYMHISPQTNSLVFTL